MNVLSGVAFDVDKERGLVGFCDFLIARSPEIFYIQGPILAVVEAKKENLVVGSGPVRRRDGSHPAVQRT